MNKELSTETSPNFCDREGRAFLVFCPNCKEKNDITEVASGVCAICGYDLNKRKVIIDPLIKLLQK